MNCHPWGPILAQGRQDSSPNPHPLTISRGQSAVGCVVLKYTCWISISPVRRSRKPQYLMQMTTMPPTLLLGKRLKTQEWAKKYAKCEPHEKCWRNVRESGRVREVLTDGWGHIVIGGQGRKFQMRERPEESEESLEHVEWRRLEGWPRGRPDSRAPLGSE